jgi:putative endonuclease
MNSKEMGFFGEKIAENYLRNKNYRILDKNYSNKVVACPQKGEIDIITRKNNRIIFFEVKSLNSDRFISPEEKVDFQKRKKIMKTAESWLVKKKISLDTPWQIDIISIKINLSKKTAKIRHFKNAVF